MPDKSSPSLISIVMPTYNRGNLIGETIESIQKQTYPCWELIIVDDGSTDNTAGVVKDINDERIHYYQRVHLGMEKARNFGLLQANGEFIGFMDSDDLWVNTKLEKQLQAFNEFPAASFCLTGGCEFKEQGKPFVFYYKQTAGSRMGNLFLSFFKSELVALTQTLIFRKECLKTTEMHDDIELAHIHFILALASHFKGCILYEPLLHRRMHNNNYSSLHQVKRHRDGIELIKHYKKKLPKKLFAETLTKSHINFGEICLHSGKPKKAIREFLQAWKYAPLNFVPPKKITKALLHFR
jgi:glycosyltransferase involved in cell wall biosynthesis